MSGPTREAVLEALRVEDVVRHLGIGGAWRGRWMRSRTCGRTSHPTDAFGIARDGMWHCFSCDEGGDLLALVAVSEGVDVRKDFGRVLEVAAAIAGVVADDDFGGGVKPPPKERPAPPPVEPIAKRLELAKRRAAWVWSRMMDRARAGERGLLADRWLRDVRGVNVDVTRVREDYRDTPLMATRDELERGGEDLVRLSRMFATPGLAVPVRSPVDGALVDIRIRRFEPREGQPKIVGMLGGVTSSPAADGRGRELLGCYGFPSELEHDTAIVTEGMVDYLTALAEWPDADAFGAVEAGTIALVAKHVASMLAARGNDTRLLIIEHADPARVDKRTGQARPGAADVAVNEEPNAAAKVAVAILGPARVAVVRCDAGGAKDLNDLVRAGVRVDPRWRSPGEAA